MKKIYLFISVSCMYLLGCNTKNIEYEGNWFLKNSDRTKILQTLIEKEIADFHELPGSLITIRSGNFLWSGAAGSFGEGKRRLIPTDVFRSASITKTFTSAAILRLVEQGKFTLNTSIDTLLKPETTEILKDGGYNPNLILVRHLLGHTAGLYDYTESTTFNAKLFSQPNHQWTREEQLKLAMNEGTILGSPGKIYAYGDTAYILLGEILEVQTNHTLAWALRSLLSFDSLGLKDTWMESLETAPPDGFSRLSHPMYGDVDTRDWDPSWDLYGGGGLISSTQDLVKFIDALFSGNVFKNKTTHDLMIAIPPVAIGKFGGLDGGMGINRTILAGHVCYAGYGFFGTEMIRCPSLDVTLARTTNQSEVRDGYDSDRLNEKILNLFQSPSSLLKYQLYKLNY